MIAAALRRFAPSSTLFLTIVTRIPVTKLVARRRSPAAATRRELDSGAVTYMANQAAADYIRNIVGSIVAFEEQPGASETAFMPSRYLANTFFLLAASTACRTWRTPRASSRMQI